MAARLQGRGGSSEHGKELVARAAVFEKVTHEDGVEMSRGDYGRKLFGSDFVDGNSRSRMQAGFW